MHGCKQLTRIALAVLSSSLVFGSLRADADPDAYVANTAAGVVSVIDTATNVVLARIPVGDSPTSVAVTRDGARVYVTNTGSDSVSVIDTATSTVVATVFVAEAPSALAVTPDGAEVYVLASRGVLQVIDTALISTATDPVIATISFGEPFVFETSIAILPDGTRAYAVVSGSLWVIDTATLDVMSSLYVGNAPSQLAISPDGTRVYVTNAFGYDTPGFDGQVVVVDTGTDSVLNAISLFNLPGSIAITPDGTRGYVSLVSRFWNTGYGIGFLPDTNVAVIDLTANVVSRWILLPGTPAGVAVTPDGSGVYVAIPDTDSISVIDVATDSLATAIGVAAEPSGLAIAPAHAVALAQVLAECENGLDDDGDGFVDHPADSGCSSATAASESPRCDDQIDNDGDGRIDMLDPQCAAPSADAEGPACGIGAELVLLLPVLLRLRARRRAR